MKRFMIVGMAVALAGLTGCASRYADVPAPTRFENAKQHKLQAAQHWQLIAGHVATQLHGDVKDRLNGRPLHVPQPGGEQAFVEGFRDLLTTALVEKGLPVSIDGKDALTVDVRYSAYRFRPERLNSTYFYGDLTALTAGLWAIGEVAGASGVSAGAQLLAVAAGAEGLSWLSNEAMGRGDRASGPVPRTEIMLTLTVADAGKIVSRKSNIYYTADEEAGLYWSRSGGGATIPVSGDRR